MAGPDTTGENGHRAGQVRRVRKVLEQLQLGSLWNGKAKHREVAVGGIRNEGSGGIVLEIRRTRDARHVAIALRKVLKPLHFGWVVRARTREQRHFGKLQRLRVVGLVVDEIQLCLVVLVFLFGARLGCFEVDEDAGLLVNTLGDWGFIRIL